MDLKQLFTDDEAVSPVIGVILMVAITVILAAVIGAFVLDIGGSQESAPQVQWDWADDTSTTPSQVIIEHGGGDTVNNPDQITLQGDNLKGDYESASLKSSQLFGSDANSISASASANIPQDNDGGLTESEDTGTLTLVWESSDGSQSTELSSHDYDLS